MKERQRRSGERGSRGGGQPRRGGTGPARAPRPWSPGGGPRREAPRGERADRYMRGGVRVVHEDDDVLVVEKPPGMLTAAVAGQKVRDATLFDLVKDYLASRMRKRGRKAWIIHRLDKEASGLLVFAKSERAFERLKDDLRAKRVHRLYSAVVEGVFEGAGARQLPSGTVQSFMFEDRDGLMRSTTSQLSVPRGHGRGDEDEGEAKAAVTHYQVLHAGHSRSLLRVRLETGRKNQIRVHMQDIGHSIVGDWRYGAKTDPISRLCLHAAELGFDHPGTGQSVRYVSPTPPAFLKLVGMARDGVEPASQQASAPSRPLSESAPVAPAESSAGRVPAAPPPAERGEGTGLGAPPATRPSPRAAPSTGWDHVAPWYDELIEDRGSDHHERVILPGTLRLLGVAPGQRVLDVACGQGILARRLASTGVKVVGVDASERLIASARRLETPSGEGGLEFLVGDARDLPALGLGEFDAAACVMALMNIDPVEPVLAGITRLVRPGGRFVAVMLHPAFRAPGQTSWGWDQATDLSRSAPRGRERGSRSGTETPHQFRRVDGYLSPAQREVVMNPGEVARGGTPIVTHTFHRPLQSYVRGFAQAGLLIDAVEEWPSLRTSQPGPRAAEENRARREIPMFVAIRGVRADRAPA